MPNHLWGLQIRPLHQSSDSILSEYATQLLVLALIAHLHYCEALLSGLPPCKIKALQMIQITAACPIFDQLKKGPLFISLHWHPVAAYLRFKALTLAVVNSTGPSNLSTLIQVYHLPYPLHSAKERCLQVPTPHIKKPQTRWFSSVIPRSVVILDPRKRKGSTLRPT